MEAPTPIQYQYASGKIPRDFNTVTPNGSVELGGTFNAKILTYCHQNLIDIFLPVTYDFIALLTCNQLFPRNSFTAIAFCAYIMGENQ